MTSTRVFGYVTKLRDEVWVESAVCAGVIGICMVCDSTMTIYRFVNGDDNDSMSSEMETGLENLEKPERQEKHVGEQTRGCLPTGLDVIVTPATV